MKTALIFLLMCLTITVNAQYPPSGGGCDIPNFGITYEVIPAKEIIKQFNKPIETIIFELPVTEDYYNSVNVGQIVTNWFKTIDNQIVVGDIPSHMWELKIVYKRKWTKQWTQLTH